MLHSQSTKGLAMASTKKKKVRGIKRNVEGQGIITKTIINEQRGHSTAME